MFCIGRIITIKYQRTNNYYYGFISPIAPENCKDIYFRLDDIAFLPTTNGDIRSGLFKQLMVHHKVNQIVAYNVADELLHSSEPRATKVALIEEVEADSLYRLVDENNLYNKKVNELLAERCPELFFGNDMVRYFRCFNLQKARQLFAERYRNGMFDKSFCRAFVIFANQDKRFDWNDDLLSMIDFESELRSDVIDLALVLVDRNYPIYELMIQCPWLVEEDKIIISMKLNDIEQISKRDTELAVRLYDRLAELSDNPSILSYIAGRMEKQKCLSNKKLLVMLDDNALVKLIKEINWNETSEQYIHEHLNLLAMVEADDQPAVASAIAETMYQQNAVMCTEWWTVLNDSIKIRIIIFLSSFFSQKGTDFLPLFKRAYMYENAKNNKLMLAVLTFVSVFYAEKDKKQKWFQKAHEILEEYIVEAFNTGVYITNALDTLMDKCKYYDSKARVFYCDAKPWEKTKAGEVVDGFYCSEGIGHYSPRKKCALYKHLDFSDTRYKKTGKYEDQHLMDLLLNTQYEPDLSWLVEDQRFAPKNGYEYPFKIAGYINRLIDMESHMKCRCGCHLVANYEYTKKMTPKISRTHFDCPEGKNQDPNEHDMDVYLNYCLQCHRVIDSRECKIQDESGYWLCMSCGGSDLYGKNRGVIKCPNCGLVDREKVTVKSADRVVCAACGHNTSDDDTWKLFANEGNVGKLLPKRINRIEVAEGMGFKAVETDELPF